MRHCVVTAAHCLRAYTVVKGTGTGVRGRVEESSLQRRPLRSPLCTNTWPTCPIFALGQRLGSPLPHLRRDWAAPATSAPGLGCPLPHLRQDLVAPCHICAGTWLPPGTSAPGLGCPLHYLRRDWAAPCHICAGTGLPPGTSALGLGSPLRMCRSASLGLIGRRNVATQMQK